MIRTEDGGRQTALEDDVRARGPFPYLSCSWFVTRYWFFWHLNFDFFLPQASSLDLLLNLNLSLWPLSFDISLASNLSLEVSKKLALRRSEIFFRPFQRPFRCQNRL